MTINYPGYGLKILSSDGTNVYFIGTDAYGGYDLPYGTHGREYSCYDLNSYCLILDYTENDNNGDGSRN